MTPSSPSPESTLDKVAGDVAEVAGVAATVAPLAGPYGLIASQVLQGIEFLAKEAPAAYGAISGALQGTQPTPEQFAALRAQVASLSLDA